jgi:hypothetical protein
LKIVKIELRSTIQSCFLEKMSQVPVKHQFSYFHFTIGME